MKIGVFDSGLWWLQTLKYFKIYLPDYDYVYLADTANNPYGEKSWSTIKDLTYKALHYLFNEKQVSLVILACNTAAAYAVRDRQLQYPAKKVLSVTIPWVEAMIHGNYKHIWVMMTQATMQSGVYPYLFGRFGGMGTGLTLVASQNIVKAVEEGLSDPAARRQILEPYIAKFLEAKADCLVLWCTHFPVWLDQIKEMFDWPIIDPGERSAVRLVEYLDRHPTIKASLSTHWTQTALVTWDIEKFKRGAKNIWGEAMEVEHISI